MNTRIESESDPSLTYIETLLAQQATEMVWLVSQVTRELGIVLLSPSAPDVTLRQLQVCMLLEGSPLTISGISTELEVSRSAVTQIADRLEKVGIVERIPTGLDHRTKFLRLTAHGNDRMHRWREQQFRQACSVLGRLSPECRIEIIFALNVLAAATGDPSRAVPQAGSY